MGNGDNDFQFSMDLHDTSWRGIPRDTPSVSDELPPSGDD